MNSSDKDPVHFLIQSVPTLSPTKIASTIKSITAREIFRRVPSVKKMLWGGEFWADGYFINTVGHKGNEMSVSEYVRNQGREKEYKQLSWRVLFKYCHRVLPACTHFTKTSMRDHSYSFHKYIYEGSLSLSAEAQVFVFLACSRSKICQKRVL